MKKSSAQEHDRRSVLLVAPQSPPYGGMAVQAEVLRERLQAEGVAVSHLPSNIPFPKRLAFMERAHFLRPFLRSIVFCRALWKALDDADVVHILACSWLFFFLVVSPAVILSRIRGKRIVLNYRGGSADAFLRRFGTIVRPVFRMVDVVTAPSQFLVDVMGARVGAATQIVPNIACLRDFSFRERSPLRPRMLVTRHLLKLYDVETVIRAYREVLRHRPEATLWIAGAGDQERYLKSMVREWRLDRVEFLGYVPHGDLPAVYAQCDILLNASLADNLPGSLLEAGAAGLVVVSTNVGGIPHLFQDGVHALLVRPKDWGAMASAALRLLNDPALASVLARNALERCREHDWQNVRPLLFKTYGFVDPGEYSSTRSVCVHATSHH
jgi:phenylacetate-CoA ligase